MDRDTRLLVGKVVLIVTTYAPLKVKVWGDYALFTQPEMKVERMSYPVMTPSAARGVLESIFWKPEMYWEVRSISVLKPIRYQSLMRNEVTTAIPETVKGKMQSTFYIEDNRTQRHSLILRDVAYVIEAEIKLKEHATDDVAKYRDMFRRRVSGGQCFQRPYLGCREFAAAFAKAMPADVPEPIDLEVGTMLFDIKYEKKVNIPFFFDAKIEGGVLKVPTELYEQVR